MVRSFSGHTVQKLPLAFGHRHAELNQDINSLYDLISGVTPALKAYESLGHAGDFYHRSAFIHMKDLALAATVCSPMAYQVTEDESLYFLLPLHGQASATSQNKHFVASSGLVAALTPGHKRKGSMSEMSMLQATLKPERLRSTALAMCGAAHRQLIDDRLERPQLLSMRAGRVQFNQMFSSICKTIDDCGLHTDTLSALGFDDLFYRSVIFMAFPELFFQPAAPPHPFGKWSIDRVCDYIDAHLTEPIYLTDLEAISELSTRSLQYAFMRKFGCTPMAWIRQRRLDLAHRRLMHAAPWETVTSIALDCGFSNAGDFAHLYASAYGVPPKSTLGRAHGDSTDSTVR